MGKSNANHRKRIAVIRSLGVRIAQAEFAASFKSFKPSLVGDLSPDIIRYSQSRKLEYHNISVKPYYFLDPVKLIYGSPRHQSWLGFDPKPLHQALSDCDLLEIYELYFFYSRQVSSYAKKSGKPLIAEVWTSFREHMGRWLPPYSFNVRSSSQAADLFILRSHRVNDYLMPLKIPARKKVVIYHGVNLSRFKPVSCSSSPTVNILFAGALASHKGLDDLLAVFPRLVRQSPCPLKLHICGNGYLESQVVEMARSFPIEFHGWYPHERIHKVFQKADIFCGPSKDFYFMGLKRSEEFVGYVFMEALASALPIVASDSGGIPEVVGDNNLIIKQNNRDALASSLLSLISDPKARRQLGKKNRARAEKLFDLHRQTALTEKVILSRFG